MPVPNTAVRKKVALLEEHRLEPIEFKRQIQPRSGRQALQTAPAMPDDITLALQTARADSYPVVLRHMFVHVAVLAGLEPP